MDPLSRQKPGQCLPSTKLNGNTVSSITNQSTFNQTQSAEITQSFLGRLISPQFGPREQSEAVTSSLASLSSAISHQLSISSLITTTTQVSDEYLSNSTFHLKQLNNSEKINNGFESATQAAAAAAAATTTTTISPTYNTAEVVYQLAALDEGGQIFLSILYTITAITSFILNIITVFVLARSGRSELRKYLINLSMSDLLMSLFSIPFEYTEYMLGWWMFGRFLCPVVKFVVTLSVFVSAATMTVIGINRHLAIIYPFRKKKCSRICGWTIRQTHVIVAIWLVGILISSPEYCMFSVEKFCFEGQYYDDCRQHWPDSSSRHYAIFIYLCTFAIPLSLLSYLYTCIGLKLWRRQMPGEMYADRNLAMQTTRLKVIKMLFVVVIVFAVSWLPMQTFSMIQFLYPEIRENIGYQSFEYNIFVCAYFASHWLSMAHSCLNPLIYCFMNDKFRIDLQALICKRSVGGGNYGAGSEHLASSQVRLAFGKAPGSLFGQVASELASGSGQPKQQQRAITAGGGAISLRRSSSSSRDRLASRHSGGATGRANKSIMASRYGSDNGSITLAAALEIEAEAAAQTQINSNFASPISLANACQLASTSATPSISSSSSASSPGKSQQQVGGAPMAANTINLEQLAERQVGETNLFVKVLRGQQSGGQQLFVYESSLEGETDIKEEEEEEEEDDVLKPEEEDSSRLMMMMMGNNWPIKEEV